MLWHANALTDRAGRTPAAKDAWGAELAEQSLADAWYPVDWQNVADDELVFLLPSLCHWLPARENDPGPRGPIDYLTRILTARADAAADLIARKTGRTEPAAAAEFADRLLASGLLSSIEPKTRSQSSASREPTSSPRQAVLPDWLAAELVALAYADRMLSDALGMAHARSVARAPIIDWPLGLSDIIAASASTRLNGAYVYPEYSYAHELFALAAVLGHLIDGRPVYLPPSLAGTLLDVLSARRSADDEAAGVLRSCAELAGGANRLMLWARIITASGTSQRIAPRTARFPRAMRAAWNARLLQRLQTLWPNS